MDVRDNAWVTMLFAIVMLGLVPYELGRSRTMQI